tara:strand:+ start:3137 stop:4246 length:1110 start_codon:yes stop_codon:yes gene_type:complete
MIPVFKPELTLADKFSVLNALLKNNISGTSPIVSDFEKQYSSKFNRKFGVAVSNGSVALDVAFNLLNLDKDDEVIVPSFTIISCLSAIIRSGGKPVFCDVNEQTWNMTLDDVKSNFSEKTKAVLVVHTYGLAAEINKIQEFCKEKNIYLIEDAAEAHGQKIDNKPCGSYGDISVFSFYANKHITTGEGGMVLTDSEEFYYNAQKIRNLDFNNEKRFSHDNFYWNYRLSGLQASLGISQLKNLNKTIEFKIKQGNYYTELLSKAENLVQLPLMEHEGVMNHYWVYGVLLKRENIRDYVMNELRNNGIETRPFFWPLHLQPALPKEYKTTRKLLVSERLGSDGLYLPMGKHVNKNSQNKISEILLRILEEN